MGQETSGGIKGKKVFSPSLQTHRAGSILTETPGIITFLALFIIPAGNMTSGTGVRWHQVNIPAVVPGERKDCFEAGTRVRKG